jgi:DNA-binding NarL/FixJ family response regulator
MSNKILIVEDDFKVARKYQEILESNGYDVVGISDTYDFALDLFFECEPELIICDICLNSKKSGIDFIKQVKKINDKVVVIFTTSYSDSSTVSIALTLHPKSYLIKPFCETQLLVSVKRVFGNYNATQLHHSEVVEDVPTKREMEVIHLIAEGYTTKEIAKALSISFETVQSHRKNVLSKFNVSSSAELISIAHCNKWLS